MVVTEDGYLYAVIDTSGIKAVPDQRQHAAVVATALNLTAVVDEGENLKVRVTEVPGLTMKPVWAPLLGELLHLPLSRLRKAA